MGMATTARGVITDIPATVRQAGIGHVVTTAALAPLLLLQAKRAVRRAPRLPAASGPPHGRAGEGDPHRRLLVIGESTAIGVGASRHDRALPGFLAAELTSRLGGTTAWTVRGQSGATARRMLREIWPAGREPFDLILLTAGINDLFDRRTPHDWAADLRRLVTALSGEDGRTRVIVSGMPPVGRIPAIPQPLRFVVARRARAMDQITQQVSAACGATYVPISVPRAAGRQLFAADGFHPSEAGYRAWAQAIAEAI
jgi:lysophospholipase L1-like esterase